MGDLINRGADNWRPLFAIADAIGGDCPADIRDVAAKLGPRESNSYGVVLLADIRAMFADKKTDRLSSAEIAGVLEAMEGRPWAEWGKARKPISKNQLARLLGEFKVAPETVRAGGATAKGYYLHLFSDAFERYLPPDGHSGASEPSHRHKPTAAGTSATFQTVTPETDVTVRKCEKPLRPSGCDGVTVWNAENAPLGDDTRPEDRRPPAISSGADDDLNDLGAL